MGHYVTRTVRTERINMDNVDNVLMAAMVVYMTTTSLLHVIGYRILIYRRNP